MKNIFYFSHINVIGGVESFYWNVAQKYQDKDITIFYKTGDPQQIKRLRELVAVKKFDGQDIKCERAFYNYNTDIIDHVDAKEHIQIIHAMHRFPLTLDDRITKFIGVSQSVCDRFHELTGKEIELVYNPFVVQKPKKILNLISATRLSQEKGRKRMVQFAKILEDKGIMYNWQIFTNDSTPISNPNIIFRKPTLNIIDHIANADYLVQLSDDEAYCYSVVEALSVGVPVIVTDCKVFHEIGIEHGKNGYIVDHELTNVPDIRKKPKFKYEPLQDQWDSMLADGKSEYKEKMKRTVQLKIVGQYFDLQLKRSVHVGEVIEVSMARAEELKDLGLGGDLIGIV